MPIDNSKEKSMLAGKDIRAALKLEGAGASISALFGVWLVNDALEASDEFVLALIGELVSLRELMKAKGS